PSDLDQVVEPGGREVLDRGGAHHELLVSHLGLEHLQVPVILDAREVEVREVPAVVDDALRVRVREAHARECGVLERRLAIRDVAELDRHDRIAASTSSRLRSMSSGERASRLRRSRGSVFEGRTFMCQSPASIETPSKWLPSPSVPKRSSSSCSFAGTSATGVLSSPVRKYRARKSARICESFFPRLETSSSISRKGTTPESACENSR